MGDTKLKAGDVVVLKSGGPSMTIEDIGEYSFKIKAKCTWFEGAKKITDCFALETLEIEKE